MFGAPIFLIAQIFKQRNYRQVLQTDLLRQNLTHRFQQTNQLKLLSLNVCLLPEIGCRVNKLYQKDQRAKDIAQNLLANTESKTKNKKLKKPLEKSSKSPHSNIQIQSFLPENLDLICLQECFDRPCSRIIVNQLKKEYPFIIWDVGQNLGSNLGKDRMYFSVENSGLLVASKYPIVKIKFKTFNNAVFGDKMASKGCLLMMLQISENVYALVVNTHIQAQNGELASNIRTNQMKFIYNQMSNFKNEFLHEHLSENYSQNCIKFEILCGDLNFNLESDKLENSVFFKNGYFKEFIDCFECKHEGDFYVSTAFVQEKIYETETEIALFDKILEECETYQADVHYVRKSGASTPTILGNNCKIRLVSKSRSESFCGSTEISYTDNNAKRDSNHSSTSQSDNRSEFLQNVSHKVQANNQTKHTTLNETIFLNKKYSNDLEQQKLCIQESSQEDTLNRNIINNNETQTCTFERHPDTNLPWKIDHIWYEPKFSSCVFSRYISAFNQLTDHIPIAAEFKLKH